MSWQEFYYELREIPDQGLCGLGPMLFTVGIFCGLHETGYAYRYCYETWTEAKEALDSWDGKGDPPGDWKAKK